MANVTELGGLIERFDFSSNLLRIMFDLYDFVEAVNGLSFRCAQGHVMTASQSRWSMLLWRYKSDRSRGAIT